MDLDDDFFVELALANPAEIAQIAPESRAELHEYILREYGFNIPQVAVCDGHCSPFDALCNAYFSHDGGERVWVGPRTGGKTLQAAILEHILMTHFADTVAHAGAIEAQALKCYEYLQRFFRSPHFAPDLLGESLMSRTQLKNGAKVEVLPMTMNRLNSPHTRMLFLDEIEQTTDKLIDEARSIPMRINGRAPLTVFTSSRKKAFGPMERMLREFREQTPFDIFTWCVFEIIEECPPERHQNGGPKGCGSCTLESVCREKETDRDGVSHFKQGPGRAARARGWMKIDDVILKFKKMARSIFNAQWLSLKPETEGLAYPMWDENIHVIDYDYNPAFPVVAGIDFGYTNASVALYAQPTPSDDVVIFAEDYETHRTADVFADSIKREPWFNKTSWRVADSAQAGDRATLIARGVANEPANKAATAEDASSVVAGINLVRWLLAPEGRPTPILYVARRCKNTIREFGTYHHPEEKDDKNPNEAPVKKDDHCMDAMRYLCRRLYRGKATAG